MNGKKFLDIIKKISDKIAAWKKKAAENRAAQKQKKAEATAARKQKKAEATAARKMEKAKKKVDELKRKLEKARLSQELLQSRRYLFAVIAIIFAVVIIIAIDFSCVWLIIHMEKEAITSIADAISTDALNQACDTLSKSFDIAQERTLLSTGLSIIGLAISVWATLNILNAFDKKDLLELDESIRNLQEDTLSLSEAKKRYDNEISQINEQNKNQFLYYLEQNAHDDSIAFVMDKFKDRKDLPYSQLAIVMQYYFNVIQLHKQTTDKEMLETTATEGMKYTEKLLTETALPEDIQQFLHYCLAELYFYRAYCGTAAKEYDDSLRAIREYEKAQNLFYIRIPEYNSTEKFDKPDSLRSRFSGKSLMPYWCNTIGECYSKAAQAYKKNPSIDITEADIDHIRNKAVFYCRYAVILSNSQNETYLRNLGCALEAANGDKPFDVSTAMDIARQYQTAMDISAIDNQIPWKVFHTWLSFYHKCINQHLNQQEPADLLASKVSLDDHPIYHGFETALAYANLACQIYPGNLVFFKFRAFVLRDRCIWEVNRNGKSKDAIQYYKAFKEAFLPLNVLFRKDPDPYMNELIKWYNALKTVLDPETKSETPETESETPETESETSETESETSETVTV